ncbi:S-layer homology domain-containing protein [Paenibacillus sp. GP183]|uniref:S-layer homology domain-containing protein n=1 Tax=Paenibacillus sp. GP183 TaxID=1882751 RepID=UPI0008975090|nr:S-layer homology domain-containing protein [Paenibacillus sp. GP183]SEC00569.1 Alpha-tubulin suppressor [Paenibacillus sp. GP183]
MNVQTGVGYTIGLKTDGTLWSWGYNKYGQLGNGTQTDKLIPVQTGNKNNWTQVSSSGEHTVATDTYGDLWAWGQNFGYLGDGTWNTKYSPGKISTVSNVTYIQAGWYSNYVINKDNALYDWGINSDYQLGDGTNNTIYEPKLIGTSQDWKAVSSNYASTFGLKKDGTLWFWGTDSNGSFFGSRYPWKIIKEPIQIGIDSDWEKISVGNVFVLATKKDGSLWVGGNNYPSNTLNNIDMKRIGNDSDWDQIVAVSSYSVGIKKDSSLWFWGDDLLNSYLPSMPIKTINAPQRIGTDSDWMKISAGNKHVLLIKRDGTLWVIGRNDSGQLGIGNRESTSTPLLIDSNKWKEAAAGSDCSFGIRSDGTLWSWGSNDFYALGLGATNITPNPNPISINFPIVNEVKSNDTDLNGITTPNAHVQISISSTVITSGKADDKGTFSIKINKQSVGTKLSIIAIDVNGQVSGVTTVSVLSYTNTSSSSSDHSSGSGDISSRTPAVEIPTEGKPVNTEPTKPTTKNVFTKNVDTVKVINSLKGNLLTAKESSAAFTDIKTHWGSQNINVFVKLGVVSGYEDGSFHPDAKITRAEFATIISKIFNIEGSSNTLSLSDVKGHWAKDEIQALASHGIINGYEDGSFKPDNSITRAEIIVILSRIIDLSTTQKLNNVTFGDVTGTWNVQQIKASAEVGLIEGRDNSIFAPNEFSTRAESLTVILRALKLNPEIKFILDQMK